MSNKEFTLNEIEIVYKSKQNLNHAKANSSRDFAAIFRQFFNTDQLELKEYFKVAYLDTKYSIINIHHIGEGGISGVVVDPRIIMMPAFRVPCTAIVMCHNHPSGNIKPSRADIDITCQIRDAAKLFDIKLLDHIILGHDNEFYSFSDEGMF